MSITNNKEDVLTFYQWLNSYEFMTKREYKELPLYKQENYLEEYNIYLNTL